MCSSMLMWSCLSERFPCIDKDANLTHFEIAVVDALPAPGNEVPLFRIVNHPDRFLLRVWFFADAHLYIQFVK